MQPEHAAFVEARVPEGFRPVALALMARIAELAPELLPGMRGGTEKYFPLPVWRHGRDVLVLSPSQRGLTLSFADGATLPDPHGRLGGAGKRSRTVLLRRLDEVESAELAALIRAAATRAMAG